MRTGRYLPDLTRVYQKDPDITREVYRTAIYLEFKYGAENTPGQLCLNEVKSMPRTRIRSPSS